MAGLLKFVDRSLTLLKPSPGMATSGGCPWASGHVSFRSKGARNRIQARQESWQGEGARLSERCFLLAAWLGRWLASSEDLAWLVSKDFDSTGPHRLQELVRETVYQRVPPSF